MALNITSLITKDEFRQKLKNKDGDFQNRIFDFAITRNLLQEAVGLAEDGNIHFNFDLDFADSEFQKIVGSDDIPYMDVGPKVIFSGKVNFEGAIFLGEARFFYATFLGEANFWNATFSEGVSFYDATFSGEASFYDATFSGEASFYDATFSGEAKFDRATFSGEANFFKATFKGEANFSEARFSDRADFWQATFSGEAKFDRATFSGEANFSEATFKGEANFSEARFSKEAHFFETTFSDKVSFDKTTFSDKVYFDGATFSDKVYFDKATFSEEVNFFETTFSREVNFFETTFSREVNFFETTFSKEAHFFETTFSRKVHFTEAIFSGEVSFDGATFSGKVSFDGATFSDIADFGQVVFLQKVDFTNTIFLNEVHFRRASFSQSHYTYFCNLNLNQKDDPDERNETYPAPRLQFRDIIFPQLILFSNCNLSQTTFERCTIADIKFRSCEFAKTGFGIFKRNAFENRTRQKSFWENICFAQKLEGRLLKKDFSKKRDEIKKEVKELEKNNEKLHSIELETEEKRKDREDLCCQMKTALESSKEWKQAGDFYIGELEARRSKNWWEYLKLTSFKYLLGYAERISILFIIITILFFAAALILGDSLYGFSFDGWFVNYNWSCFEFDFEKAAKSTIFPLTLRVELKADDAIKFWETVFLIISWVLWITLAVAIRRRFRF